MTTTKVRSSDIRRSSALQCALAFALLALGAAACGGSNQECTPATCTAPSVKTFQLCGSQGATVVTETFGGQSCQFDSTNPSSSSSVACESSVATWCASASSGGGSGGGSGGSGGGSNGGGSGGGSGSIGQASGNGFSLTINDGTESGSNNTKVVTLEVTIQNISRNDSLAVDPGRFTLRTADAIDKIADTTVTDCSYTDRVATGGSYSCTLEFSMTFAQNPASLAYQPTQTDAPARATISLAACTVCGTDCVDLQSDPDNCGSCNNAIPQVDEIICAGGQPECFDVGYLYCDGACVQLEHDTSNCGGCGVTCGSNQVCEAGVCQSTTDVTNAFTWSSGLTCESLCAAQNQACVAGTAYYQISDPSSNACISDQEYVDCNEPVPNVNDINSGTSCATPSFTSVNCRCTDVLDCQDTQCNTGLGTYRTCSVPGSSSHVELAYEGASLGTLGCTIDGSNPPTYNDQLCSASVANFCSNQFCEEINCDQTNVGPSLAAYQYCIPINGNQNLQTYTFGSQSCTLDASIADPGSDPCYTAIVAYCNP